nr:copia protein [Tanacetum cinerariifolium]
MIFSQEDTNLISIFDMAASSPVCLMSKATSTKLWLWHRRLSHLNLGTINDLTRLDLVDGVPKFKYEKDHLCSGCERGKSKKASHPPKLVSSDNSKLELLHMDLCSPMRVALISGKNTIEPKNIKEAMVDHSWIESMQDELNQFERLQVWELVPRPEGKNIITLKWLWKNKCDVKNIVVRNKTRLVAKGYMHEKGIDFEESFAPVARLEPFGCGKLVSWSSEKQYYIAMSTAEAEYVSLSACCAQVIWMRTQLLDYGYKYNRILMYCDSKSAIVISCNLVHHSKTKHIDIRYHFIKEHVEKCTVELYFVGTEYQLSDLFTKALLKECFEYLVYRTVIIMAHQKHVVDVHPDELCPPNKRADMEGNLLFSSSFNIFDSVSKIHEDHHWEIQRQTQNKDSRLDDLRRDKANGALSDVCEVFGIDVPLIQSPLTESTQKTHKTSSALRSPTPKVDASASTRSTVIRFRLPQRKSTRLTPPAPVLTVDKADELILQDTLQVSLAEHKSRQEPEARENVALIEKHLAYEEVKKMVERQEHVVDDSSIPRNDEHNISSARLEPKSDKESLEELQGCYGYLFEHLRAKFMPRKSFVTLAGHLHEAMADSLPTMVDKHIKEQVEKQVPKHVRNQVLVYVAKGLILERQKTKEETEKMIAKAILQKLGNIQAQISSQI